MILSFTLTASVTEEVLNKHSFKTYDIGIQHLQTDGLVTFYLNLSQNFLFGQNRKQCNLLTHE